MVQRFKNLQFDIYYFSLYLEDIQFFEKRLKRVHHNYQAFSLENSMNQQYIYMQIANELKEVGIPVYEIAMDNPTNAYSQIAKILNL